jgi:hypothetical protein
MHVLIESLNVFGPHESYLSAQTNKPFIFGLSFWRLRSRGKSSLGHLCTDPVLFSGHLPPPPLWCNSRVKYYIKLLKFISKVLKFPSGKIKVSIFLEWLSMKVVLYGWSFFVSVNYWTNQVSAFGHMTILNTTRAVLTPVLLKLALVRYPRLLWKHLCELLAPRGVNTVSSQSKYSQFYDKLLDLILRIFVVPLDLLGLLYNKHLVQSSYQRGLSLFGTEHRSWTQNIIDLLQNHDIFKKSLFIQFWFEWQVLKR